MGPNPTVTADQAHDGSHRGGSAKEFRANAACLGNEGVGNCLTPSLFWHLIELERGLPVP
jgi:hypothetical protein